MDKKVIIIGAGVSGLSLGIFAQKYGFKTVIYEKNKFAGGNLTGWCRQGCYIDNCIHWLNGSKDGTQLNKLWKELGGIDDETVFHQSEYFYVSELGKKCVGLGQDLEKTRSEMLKVSPQDEKQINKFINCVNSCIKLMEEKPLKKLSALFSMLKSYGRKTLGEVSKLFISPLLQRLMCDYILPEYSIYVLIFAYASFVRGDGKVLVDGSKSMADKMIEKYLNLGGEIRYEEEVKQIVTKLDSATGIILKDNKYEEADYVVSATDTFITFNKLLPSKLMPKSLAKTYNKRKIYPIISSFHIAYKVNRPCDLPQFDTLVIETKSIKIGKSYYNRIMLRSYEYGEGFTQDNSFVMQVFLLQRERDFDYFSSLKKEEYENEKKRIVKEITEEIIKKFPSLQKNLVYLDCWTPLTYTKYFNAYKGSYMTFGITKNIRINKIKHRVGKFKNLFLATQWQSLFGGLPNAAENGKKCAELIVRNESKT